MTRRADPQCGSVIWSIPQRPCDARRRVIEIPCEEMGVPAAVQESRRAMEGPAILRRLNWRFRGRRPCRLRDNRNLTRTRQHLLIAHSISAALLT